MYLSEVTFQNSQDEEVKIGKDDIDVDSDMDINVSLKGFDNEKINQITQFMNLVAPMIESGAVEPEIFTELTNETAKIWEFNKISKMLDASSKVKAEQKAMMGQQQNMMGQQQNMMGQQIQSEVGQVESNQDII